MNEVLPYRLNSQLDKTALVDRLRDLLKAWREEWLQKPVELSLDWLSEEESANYIEGKWLLSGEAPDSWLAWKFDSGLANELLSLMFNVPLESATNLTPLTQEISKECLASLGNAIFASFAMPKYSGSEWAESLADVRISKGSGALIGIIKGFALPQYIAIGGEVIKQMIGSKAGNAANSYPLVSRESVLGNHGTCLEVTMGTAQLTLEALANIEVGDVIKINTSIQQPLKVKTSEGVTIAGALLGVKDDYKAIQITEL